MQISLLVKFKEFFKVFELFSHACSLQRKAHILRLIESASSRGSNLLQRLPVSINFIAFPLSQNIAIKRVLILIELLVAHQQVFMHQGSLFYRIKRIQILQDQIQLINSRKLVALGVCWF